MDERYCVYKHTSPSGKVYIGITGRKPEIRFQNGNGYSGNEYFSNAIRKYGWDNFKHEVLASNLAHKQACDIEKHLIAQYKSHERCNGYNIALGGEGPQSMSDETKWKISKNHRCVSGKLNPRYGAKNSDATREKIKAALAKKHPWTGKHHTEQAKQKIGNANKGRTRTEETKLKISEANKGNKVWFGRKHAQSSKEKMRGRRESITGTKNPKSKSVNQYSKNGELVASFPSANQAEYQMTQAKHPCNISACCRGKLKTAYGYIWRYAE